MTLQIAAANVDCPHRVSALISDSLCASYSSIKERRRDQYLSPFKSRKLYKSLVLLDNCDSRAHEIKSVCRASLDDGFSQCHESWGLSEACYGHLVYTGSCATTETKHSPSRDRSPLFSKNSFWLSQVDLLEPKMLGISPEPPDWPERESVMLADVERKANSFDVPFSLKMIQKRRRRQREGGLRRMRGLDFSSVAKAFSSMVSIIVELQSCALQMREEALCDKDLELMIYRVQKEVHSSFVWLFQQVFSRTPTLMVHVMILLSNFSVYSASPIFAATQASLLGSLHETGEQIELLQHSQLDNSLMAPLTSTDSQRRVSGFDSETTDAEGEKHFDVNPEEILQVGDITFRNANEVSLWNSFLDETETMRASLGEVVLDHDVLRNFVSPISVELEPDDYMEFLRTDLLYQMGLSREPDNPLLLCNYAQFLQFIARDHDRAEECFKRAIEVEPRDAELLSRYADFLWIVRNDLWRAEDAYLQAVSIEPENTYYASKYADFLWNTGGEETCFPLDASDIDSRRIS